MADKVEETRKRSRAFEETPLENQLFDWEDWQETCEPGDVIFTGIKMLHSIVGFPPDDQIKRVYWVPSCSYVEFIFGDGSSRKFGLKVSLLAIY
jgi:hypothetical protein